MFDAHLRGLRCKRVQLPVKHAPWGTKGIGHPTQNEDEVAPNREWR
jgi:hypothetical protein